MTETNGTWDTRRAGARHCCSQPVRTHRSTRCRAARRATAAPSGSTPTAPALPRRFWSTRPTAPGAPPAQVPGLAALNTDNEAELASVSCPAAGNCSAGGYYVMALLFRRLWSARPTAPGAKLRRCPASPPSTRVETTQITSVSCASAGNCSVGGYYLDGSRALQAFVVSQTSGKWGTAKQVPGLAALNKSGDDAD